MEPTEPTAAQIIFDSLSQAEVDMIEFSEFEDPYSPIVEDFFTLLSGFWAECKGNGGEVASCVAARWFEDNLGVWGNREVADVHVIIASPIEAAGSYGNYIVDSLA